MSAAKRFLSLFLSAALVVGMSPDCAYAKVTAQMLRAAASQLPSPAQGDGAPQAAPDSTGAAQGQESAQDDVPQAAPDGAGAAQGQEPAQGDAGAGTGGQAAEPQSADQGGGLSWREAEGGVEVTGYAGDATDLAIPSELGGRPVVRVGASAFRGCTSLRSVSLPPTVESVGDGAFSGCSSLASLTLPEGLRGLGSNAFTGCAVESVTIPASLESTGAHRWAGGPFEGSSLRSATLAEGSVRVAPGLFSGCSTLSSVSVPETVTTVGEYAFRGCSGLPASLEVPPSVRELHGCAYEGCTSIESVTLPATVTSVGEGAFRGCSSLRSVSLPASVASVGDGAFEGCSDALTLRFPTNYVLLRYVFENHLRYEVLVGNMAMGQGVLDASGSGYSCEGADGEGHLRLRLRYEVAQGEGDGLSEMALRLRIPDQAQVLRGSVRLDGEVPEGLAERQGMLTIPVRGTSGSVELTVRAVQHGRLQSYASLNYTKGGQRHDDLIGYVDEGFPETTMELPTLVGAGCLIGGVAAPGSTVTILADGEPAGSGDADAKGRYSISVSIAGGEGGAYSFQALAAGAASVARDAEYDPAFPEVRSVTLEYRNRGREGRLELMDPAAADQHVHRDISSPPTYRVAFTDPDAVAEVSVTGRGRGKERTLRATRQADGTWATSGFFDESDKNFNPQSVTVHHRARVSAASADGGMQQVNDRLFERFDRERQEFSWDYDCRKQVEEDYNKLMEYSNPKQTLRETAARLRDETLREFGLDALGSVIPSIGDLKDAVDKLDNMHTIAEEGRLIIALINKSNSGAGLDDKEKAVLVMHMLRVMECIGTYLVIDELAPTYQLLFCIIFTEAQLFSLATLMKVNSAFADDFEGIRSDLKQMGPGNYGNFAAVAERFKGFFDRFCAAAKEDAERSGKDTTPSSPSASGDPSGYVYEAVPGNRLQGAEVSLYCEDDISQAPLLWDAVAYGQEARQVTGADGAFGWDVPDGRWQVRCAMAGYEPYVGEWLEVPPEHTDVGVAMVCREAPRVAGARARDGEVLLSFSRYMVPESVRGVRLLDAGGAEVPFELEWRAEEGDGGRTYAREYTLRLRAEAQAGPYTLRASGEETSYAGVRMEAGDTAVS